MPVATEDTMISFGAYKGQSLSELSSDQEYVDWFLKQPGLREKYPEIVDFLEGSGKKQAGRTPAHNKLQAKFLDEAYCACFLIFLNPDLDLKLRSVFFERFGVDVILITQCGLTLLIEVKPSIGDDYPDVLRQVLKKREMLFPRDPRKGSGLVESKTRFYVYTESFRSDAINLEQAKKFFGTGRTRLLVESEIDFF